MRAWVARRRDGGALLDAAAPFGPGAAPFELVVVEVTDQGRRRPTRIARLVPVGQRVAVAELIAPKLVWYDGWDFVLSGTDELVGERGIVHAAQSWYCRLATSPYATGVIARHTHDRGSELRRGAIFDRYGAKTKGQLHIASVHAEALGRHTLLAELWQSDGGVTSVACALLDAELMWMGDERFAISGLWEYQGGANQSTLLLRQGWICEYEIVEPAEATRKPKSAR